MMESLERAPGFEPEIEVDESFEVLDSWDAVPMTDTESDEALFWERARPSLKLMEGSVVTKPSSSESVAISLRVDSRMLARMKRVARSRYLNYQSMIKQWLAERLEKEGQDL